MQMKELHPRFRFHINDWLTYHFLLGHCATMSRTFTKLGVDPDVQIYQDFLEEEDERRQRDARYTLKRR